MINKLRASDLSLTLLMIAGGCCCSSCREGCTGSCCQQDLFSRFVSNTQTAAAPLLTVAIKLN